MLPRRPQMFAHLATGYNALLAQRIVPLVRKLSSWAENVGEVLWNVNSQLSGGRKFSPTLAAFQAGRLAARLANLELGLRCCPVLSGCQYLGQCQCLSICCFATRDGLLCRPTAQNDLLFPCRQL